MLATRVLDGFSASLIIATLYHYSKNNLISQYSFWLAFSLGFIIGPLISHYYDDDLIFSLVPLLAAFILPAVVLVCSFMIENKKYHFASAKTLLWLTICMIVGVISFIFILKSGYWSGWYPIGTIIFCLIFIVTLFGFVNLIKDTELLYLVGFKIPTRTFLIVLSSFLLFSSTTFLWILTIPTYLIHIENYQPWTMYASMFLFFLCMIIGTYTSYHTKSGKISISKISISYGLILSGLALIIYFADATFIWQIVSVNILLGLGLGMLLMLSAQILNFQGFPAHQLLITSIFYTAAGVLLTFPPLVLHFFSVETHYNASLLLRHDVMMPEVMGKPIDESSFMLSDNVHILDTLKNFTHEQFNNLKNDINISYIRAFHDAAVILFIPTILLLLCTIKTFSKGKYHEH